MNSAKHNRATGASDLSAAVVEPSDREDRRICTRLLEAEPAGQKDWFCAEVADGLHALAQPLTILRSALTLLAQTSEAGSDHRRYLEMSTKQVERTCSLFASIQNLVASRLEPAECVSLDLWAMVARAIEAKRPVLHERGIELVAAHPDSLPPAFADPQRTADALSILFDTLSSVFSHGDTIEIGILPAENSLAVLFEGRRALTGGMKPADRVNLSVVKANILSQSGTYRFVEEPFCVVLAWAAAKPNLQDVEAFSEAFTN